MASKINYPPESTLLAPVLDLFPTDRYSHVFEAPLGKKRIDLLCVPHSKRALWYSVELKVRDWRRAIWQAITNFQMAERSYIALWYRHIPATKEFDDLLTHYGIGLIEVWPTHAHLIRSSAESYRRNGRDSFRANFRQKYPE